LKCTKKNSSLWFRNWSSTTW